MPEKSRKMPELAMTDAPDSSAARPGCWSRCWRSCGRDCTATRRAWPARPRTATTSFKRRSSRCSSLLPTSTTNAAVVSLRTFMRLPPLQRSVVIFKDVLGYSLDEVVQFTGSSIPAVKSALQRGRGRLQELAKEPDDAPLPELPDDQRRLLSPTRRTSTRVTSTRCAPCCPTR